VLVLVLALVLGGGCRTRLLELDDGGARTDGGAVDLAGQPPVDLAGVCAAHTRRPVALTGLMPLDPTFQMRTDRAVRLAVSFPLRPCDEPAGIDVAIAPGNATDFVSITAYRWEGSGPACSGLGTDVVRGVVIGDERLLTNLRIVVRDTQRGVGDLTLTPGRAQPGSCVAVADGQPCERDCQCLTGNARARCIPTTTGARCGVPCGTDADCPTSAPDCANRADGRARVCGPRAQCCDEMDDCHRPLACERCFCVAPDPAQPPFSIACACDGDCPQGTICDGGRGRCVLSCETTAQCPSWAVACAGGECAFGE
jgi:hypothetical protein